MLRPTYAPRAARYDPARSQTKTIGAATKRARSPTIAANTPVVASAALPLLTAAPRVVAPGVGRSQVRARIRPAAGERYGVVDRIGSRQAAEPARGPRPLHPRAGGAIPGPGGIGACGVPRRPRMSPRARRASCAARGPSAVEAWFHAPAAAAVNAFDSSSLTMARTWSGVSPEGLDVERTANTWSSRARMLTSCAGCVGSGFAWLP